MNAEQMFEELGYKQVRNDSCLIKYEQFINGNCTQITFTLLLKKVIATYGYQTSGSYAHDITSDEFRAIVQQEKELGWLEEKKQEIKQETNFQYYKDEILECCLESLAVVKGRPKLCYKTNCNDCDFKIIQKGCHKKVKDWLKQPHEKPVYKLTKFEKELLQCYPDIYSFKVFNSLNGMKEKGYFKGIDDNEIIGDILAKCEVIEDRKEVIKND
ncbi:hypothetical protein [Holdemanella sp.]|uniref:hypothetical protein n=1 Tax=Holdemanella sp. TaxID=1971762 RepID=UPI0030802F16